MKKHFIAVIICFILCVFWAMAAAADETVEIELNDNWNLISIPLQPQSTSIEQVLLSINGQYRDVWRYDPFNAGDAWKHYHPAYASFSDLNTIEPNKGYWIYSNQNTTLTISGTPIAATQAMPLKDGWNLVGWPFSYNQPISEALSSLNIGADYDQVTRFNPSTQSYENYFGQPGDQFSTFEAGKAYYIHATRSVTLNLVFDITPPAPPTVNYTTPTKWQTQTLSGTKEINASIWINGVEKVPVDGLTTWSVSVSLQEGSNSLTITSKDSAGNESTPNTIVILLDTIGPNILAVGANPVKTNYRTTVTGSVETTADLKEVRLEGPIQNSPITIPSNEIIGGIFTKIVTVSGTGSIIATAYDNLDNVGAPQSVTVTLGTGETSITYSYDDLNHLNSMVYSDGTSIAFTYDEDGNITSRTSEGRSP